MSKQKYIYNKLQICIFSIVNIYYNKICKGYKYRIQGEEFIKIKCVDNTLCSTLTLDKEYLVIEEAPEYYVVLDDVNNETTCKKSRFVIVEDGGITKKLKATLTELNYQIDNDCKDIKQFKIRKNSKGEIKEISIKFKYDI